MERDTSTLDDWALAPHRFWMVLHALLRLLHTQGISPWRGFSCLGSKAGSGWYTGRRHLADMPPSESLLPGAQALRRARVACTSLWWRDRSSETACVSSVRGALYWLN